MTDSYAISTFMCTVWVHCKHVHHYIFHTSIVHRGIELWLLERISRRGDQTRGRRPQPTQPSVDQRRCARPRGGALHFRPTLITPTQD